MSVVDTNQTVTSSSRHCVILISYKRLLYPRCTSQPASLAGWFIGCILQYIRSFEFDYTFFDIALTKTV